MRSRFAFLLLLLATAAFARGQRYRYEWATDSNAQACSAGSCTRTTPTAASEGMSLAGVVGYRLTICAALGQTLSGAGTMQAYVYHPDEQVWVRDADLDQTVSVSGGRCQAFPDFQISFPSGMRVLFAASSVTVSGGSGLDVLLDAN